MALQLVDQLADELAQIRGELARCSGILGREPDEDGEGGSGLAGTCDRLRRVVGHSPDGATGDPGSGLCRIVAELATDRLYAGRRMAGAGAAGAAGAAAMVELALHVFRMIGGG